MNFELGEINSSSRAAAVFNRGGSSSNSVGGGGGSQSINFPNVQSVGNRFLDDGDKLHSDLVGLSVATVATRQRDIEDIFEDRAAEEGLPAEGERPEEAEPPMEVEDLEHLGEQEVFSLVTRKPNEV